MTERQKLRKYGLALELWARKFNTAEIAGEIKVDEPTVERWIWNWREVSRAQ